MRAPLKQCRSRSLRRRPNLLPRSSFKAGSRYTALNSLFDAKAKDTLQSPPSTQSMAPTWPWPSTKNPRTTQSTRSATPPGAKTIASIFLDSSESSFTASSAPLDRSDSLSKASEPSATCGDPADDAVVRGVRSDRLLFDPPGESATSSILDEKASSGAAARAEEAFVGGVAVAFESADPYADFRASMVEMVAAHGVGDWAWMEEMLAWYLRANDQDTHCAIVAAFIDVVIAIADPVGEVRSSGRTSSRTFPAVELEAAEKSKPDVLI